MSYFYVKFDTDNADFAENGGLAVAEILRKIAFDLDDAGVDAPIHTQTIRDGNGNRVGGWKWVEE